MTNNVIEMRGPDDATGTPASQRHTAWEAPYLVAFLFLCMLALPFLPWLLHADDVLKKQPLGRLQSVRYVGGIRTDTQLEVSGAEGVNPSGPWQSYLLRGIAIVPPQAELELQQGIGSTQICIQHTEQCWTLLGH